MIYGYGRKTINDYGLLELEEVSIALPPEKLRDLAKFLQTAADRLSSGSLAKGSHMHADEELTAKWAADAGFDFIVLGDYPDASDKRD